MLWYEHLTICLCANEPFLGGEAAPPFRHRQLVRTPIFIDHSFCKNSHKAVMFLSVSAIFSFWSSNYRNAPKRVSWFQLSISLILSTLVLFVWLKVRNNSVTTQFSGLCRDKSFGKNRFCNSELLHVLHFFDFHFYHFISCGIHNWTRKISHWKPRRKKRKKTTDTFAHLLTFNERLAFAKITSLVAKLSIQTRANKTVKTPLHNEVEVMNNICTYQYQLY